MGRLGLRIGKGGVGQEIIERGLRHGEDVVVVGARLIHAVGGLGQRQLRPVVLQLQGVDIVGIGGGQILGQRGAEAGVGPGVAG